LALERGHTDVHTFFPLYLYRMRCTGVGQIYPCSRINVRDYKKHGELAGRLGLRQQGRYPGA
jgi:hypothetical protein